MIILGIETSCDDTGIAIVEVAPTKVGVVFNILSNTISSQIKTHAPFGGVVPNLAAREHLKNIEPCLKTALKEANTRLDSRRRVDARRVDLIAVTIGPGLIPSLLIGVNFAKALAYKYKIPIVGVNHIEGHITAAFGSEISNSEFLISKQKFPIIALTVSGGHTQLVLVKSIGHPAKSGASYKIIGETLDDAAGECFDKVAKLLKLGYPGGPIISIEAEKFKKFENSIKIQNSKFKIILPRPMIKHKNFDFSFSGLKTAVLYLTQKMNHVGHRMSHMIPEICQETQQAIIDVLIDKTLRAAKEYKVKTIILAGGVAANDELRKQFKLEIKNLLKIENCPPAGEAGKLKIDFLVPPKNLCTDNGAMIAMAGFLNRKKACPAVTKQLSKIKADANLRIS